MGIEDGHVLIRGTLEHTDEYQEIKSIVTIGRHLQDKLQLVENPRYTWSIFPEWKDKIEAASGDAIAALKADYMFELRNNVEMHYELIHHNYRFQLKNYRNQVLGLQGNISKLAVEKTELELFIDELRDELRDEKEKEPMDLLPAEGLVRIKTILQIYPVSRATWFNGVKSGRFPKPVKLGIRIRAWRVEDIRALIAKGNVDD